ncbi:MAG: DUF4836 family protein [Muribaculaceae bacterium]|nr:DUF4836 family protein [Muribaculaceae bacterium]
MAANQFDNRAMLQVGSVLRNIYRIDGYLASGGFGNTYLATNLEFKETVAIKEFFMRGVSERNDDYSSISVSNSDNVQMFDKQLSTFKREAVRLRKLGSMNNSHIVKVHDIFEENNTAYYVMQYIKGKSLGELLKQYNKPFDQGWLKDNLLPQLLDALDVIHKNNLWHLDIKPSNIMFDSKGNATLIDFGSSKQIDPSSGDPITMSSTLSFTKTYAPLELQQYEIKKIGPWSDFYSLGATLYNLGTNQKPPSSTDILYEGANAFKFGASTRPDFKELVMWLMSNKIENRPQNVAQITNYIKTGRLPQSQPAVQTPQPRQVAQPYPSNDNTVMMSQQQVQPQPNYNQDRTVMNVNNRPGQPTNAFASQPQSVPSQPASWANNMGPNGVPANKPKKKTGLIIGIAAAAAVVLGLILFFVLRNMGGNGYQAYIPADSKIVGKFDLKQFISQTGIDQDKLFKDIVDDIGDDFGDMKKCGLDLSSPVYLFARKNGQEFIFGLVGGVDNRGDAETFLSKDKDLNFEKGSPYSYSCQSDNAIAVNDEAFVLLSSTASDKDAIKADLDRVMNKMIDGKIGDNFIFKQADASKSFASLYADLSIIPEEMLNEAKQGLNYDSEYLNYIREMVVGLDGTAHDGVVDIKTSVKSDNSSVQEKINKSLKPFGAISGQVKEAFSADDMMGLAFIADGSQLSGIINEIVSKINAGELRDKTTRQIVDKIISYVGQIKGNVTFSMKDEDNYMLLAEGKDFSGDMANYAKQLSSSSVSSTGNGYCLMNEFWFGYQGNKFYLTPNKDRASQPLTVMGNQAPTALFETMNDSRVLCFFNMKMIMEMSGASSNPDAKPFKEVLDKINYVTISYK